MVSDPNSKKRARASSIEALRVPSPLAAAGGGGGGSRSAHTGKQLPQLQQQQLQLQQQQQQQHQQHHKPYHQQQQPPQHHPWRAAQAHYGGHDGDSAHGHAHSADADEATPWPDLHADADQYPTASSILREDSAAGATSDDGSEDISEAELEEACKVLLDPSDVGLVW